MRRTVIYLVVAVVLTFILGSSTALAKEKNQDRGPKDRPAGWEQGEKTGWDADTPPGLEKKADDEDMKKEKKEKKEKKKDRKKVKKKKGEADDEAVEEVDEDGNENNDEEGMKAEDKDEDKGEVKGDKGGDKDSSRGKKRGFFKRLFGGGEEQ